MSRRVVRLDDRFFEQLDRQLGSERGPAEEPSSTAFLLVELPPIAEEFATRFGTLVMPIAGRSDYRSLISVGRLVPRVLVNGVLMADETVSLIGVQIDLEPGWAD